MGTVVKRHLAARWGAPPEKVYHVAVMPCADKKLEAARCVRPTRLPATLI